jgi:hypothetical protein
MIGREDEHAVSARPVAPHKRFRRVRVSVLLKFLDLGTSFEWPTSEGRRGGTPCDAPISNNIQLSAHAGTTVRGFTTRRTVFKMDGFQSFDLRFGRISFRFGEEVP